MLSYCNPVSDPSRSVPGHQPENSPTAFAGRVGTSTCKDWEDEERQSAPKINRWLAELVSTKRRRSEISFAEDIFIECAREATNKAN